MTNHLPTEIYSFAVVAERKCGSCHSGSLRRPGHALRYTGKLAPILGFISGLASLSSCPFSPVSSPLVSPESLGKCLLPGQVWPGLLTCKVQGTACPGSQPPLRPLCEDAPSVAKQQRPQAPLWLSWNAKALALGPVCTKHLLGSAASEALTWIEPPVSA